MNHKSLTQIRALLLLFIVCIFLSGLTAIPIDRELSWLLQWVPPQSVAGVWGMRVLKSYTWVKEQYPFLLYGYDWLAFAHFVLAILFIGPYNDPVKNKWVLQFGLIACGLIIPFAFCFGALRGIPVWWRLIDCSFAVFGFAVLWPCYRMVCRATPITETFSKPHAHVFDYLKS